QICNTVLARDPGNDAARDLRDRARAAASAVNDGLQRARTLFAAGQFEEAQRAAGEVLGKAPGNTEAQQIMANSAPRPRGRGADDARAQLAHSRTAARSAGAQKLAATAYAAAASAEREAERLYGSGRLGDATVKFYQ